MRCRRTLLLPLLVAACTNPPEPSGDSPGKSKTAPSPKDTPTPVPPATPKTPTTPDVPKKPPVPPQPPVPSAEPEVVAEVATGFNAFGIDLYRKVGATPGDQVISPASIALALSMTHAGARGETAKEIAEALHYPRAAPVVQRGVATILTDYGTPTSTEPGSTVLSVANRLFGEKTIKYEAPFLNLSNRFFRAPLEPTDFKGAAEPSRTRINHWVEEKTRDRIKDLLPAGSIDASTRLVLVNAIYFKAAWAEEFNEGATAPAPFFTTATPHDVATMHATKSFGFAEADGVEVVELPYRDRRFAMTIVLPTKQDGLSAVESSLSAETIEQWHEGLKTQRIDLSMPKFKIAPSESIRLAETLGELGIKQAFSNQADFSGIAPKEEAIQLSEAFHKGFIEVDEKGTEAAAATAIVARAGSAMPSEPPRAVKVDRPFLYFIRDTKTGLLLFVGRVVDPKTE